MNSQHPRQFGYFTPPPLPMSIMGELLAQVANQGVDVWHAGPFAAFVEEEVVRWLCDLVGYDAGSLRVADHRRGDGQLHGHDPGPRPPSGQASRAVGRHRAAGISRAPASTRATRPTSASRGPSTSSASRRRRSSSSRLTTPSACVARPVAEAIARDRAAGLTPVRDRGGGRVDQHGLGRRDRGARRRRRAPRACGSTSTRPMAAAARLSDRDAGARAGPRTVRIRSPLDPHKWFFQAYDIGGLLVRDRRRTWRPCSAAGRPSTTAAARRPERGRSTDGRDDDHGDQLNFYKLSFEGTRRWRALKLWMSWKHLGTERLRPAHRGQRRPRRVPRRPLRRGGRLRGAARGAGAVRRVLPPPAGGRRAAAGEALDAPPGPLQRALEVSGDGWLTTTRLRGATWLRAGIVNYLATEDDIDHLLATLRRLAGELRLTTLARAPRPRPSGQT